MSVTVRNWTPEELESAATGSDLKLTTLLLNHSTFSATEHAAYVRALGLKKTYWATWNDDAFNPIKFFAPNDTLALWFLDQEYTLRPDELREEITTWRDVEFLTKVEETEVKSRLEYLRGEIQAERISYFEIAELQRLAKYIDAGDVELLQWAGVCECCGEPLPNCELLRAEGVKRWCRAAVLELKELLER